MNATNALVQPDNTMSAPTPTKVMRVNFGTLHRQSTHSKPSLIANVITEEKIDHSADAIADKEKINRFISRCYSEGYWGTTTMFVVGINTGFRVSDLWNMRVCDLFNEDGSVRDFYAVYEQKTGKPRKVYLNDTVKKALILHVTHGRKKYDDYLYTADKRPDLWKYIDYTVYNISGNPADITRTTERIAPDGTERPQAPRLCGDVTRLFKIIAKKLGMTEHCSTHCMRQTYSYWFSRTVGINENSDDFITGDSLQLLSTSLNHSDKHTTLKHYAKCAERVTIDRQLALNLGAEAVDEQWNKFFDFHKSQLPTIAEKDPTPTEDVSATSGENTEWEQMRL